MALRRRQVLALAATGLAPALAGCSPCGETWTGVGFAVEPTAVERADGWRVEAELTVEFNFGREGTGFERPALALFGTDGAVLDEAPVDGLTWSDVPEAKRESDDCGEYATVTREATLAADSFPRLVGLRYDRFDGGYPDPRTVSRYPDGTPTGDVSATDYESVEFEDPARSSEKVDGGTVVRAARFDPGVPVCEARTASAEARTNVHLVVRGDRSLPAERYHPTLLGFERDGDRLTLAVGLRTGPRFRRAECRRVPWVASIDVDRPERMPTTVGIRTLDADGSVARSRVVDVETDDG